MLSVNILEMYTESFESLIKLPKLSNHKRVSTATKSFLVEEKKAEEKKLSINYFAGPTNVFIPAVETAV